MKVENTERFAGVRVEVLRFAKDGHRLVKGDAVVGSGPEGLRIHPYAAIPMAVRQLRITLAGKQDGILIEPGALQSAHGKPAFETRKMENAGGFLRRRIAAAGTGEAAHQTVVTGPATVVTEPTTKHLVLLTLDEGDEILLGDGVFYAASASCTLSVHKNATVGSFFGSGNGFFQPKLKGPGVVVLETSVPVEDIEEIALGADEVVVIDGDILLFHDSGMETKLGLLFSGARDNYRGGEGLVRTVKGPGTVRLMPGASIEREISD